MRCTTIHEERRGSIVHPRVYCTTYSWLCWVEVMEWETIIDGQSKVNCLQMPFSLENITLNPEYWLVREVAPLLTSQIHSPPKPLQYTLVILSWLTCHPLFNFHNFYSQWVRTETYTLAITSEPLSYFIHPWMSQYHSFNSFLHKVEIAAFFSTFPGHLYVTYIVYGVHFVFLMYSKN